VTTFLSQHFSLEELTTTQVRSVDNTAPPEVVTVLQDTAAHMEIVRSWLGQPIHVNSGYRCPTLNRIIGSKPTSAHITGHAVDFICPGFGTPLDVCRAIEDAGIQFDQLIWEGSWTHISFDPRMRQQVLTMKKGRYTFGLNT
jgi:putative chitinase